MGKHGLIKKGLIESFKANVSFDKLLGMVSCAQLVLCVHLYFSLSIESMRGHGNLMDLYRLVLSVSIKCEP